MHKYQKIHCLTRIFFTLIGLLLGFYSTVYTQMGPESPEQIRMGVRDSIELAMKNNPQIDQYRAQFALLKSQVQATRGLYDWNLNAMVDYSDVDQPRVVVFQPSNIKELEYGIGINKQFSYGTQFDVQSGIVRTQDNSTFNLINKRYTSDLAFQLRQDLLQGFWGRPEHVLLKTNEDRLRAFQYKLWSDMEGFLGGVALAYWNLWLDQELYRVSEALEGEAEELYQETRKLLRTGLREEDEVLQAETSWLERQEETLLAKTNLENAWLDFKIQMGIEQDEKWAALPIFETPAWAEMESEQESMRLAYENRHDLSYLENLVSINQELVKSNQWNTLPELTAVGGYALTGLDAKVDRSWEQVTSSDYPGWNIGMELKHSFGQNIDRSQILQAESQLLNAKSSYEALVDLITSDVSQKYKNHNLNLKLLALATQIEEKSERVFKLTKRKFDQGRVSLIDLLRTEEDSRRARYRKQIAQANAARSYTNNLVVQGRFLKDLKIDSAQLSAILNREMPTE